MASMATAIPETAVWTTSYTTVKRRQRFMIGSLGLNAYKGFGMWNLSLFVRNVCVFKISVRGVK